MSVHYSSKTDEWSTPQDFFDDLNKEFIFTLDPCATAQNAKVNPFYTKKDDGLSLDWGKCTVFMNPPYGREIGSWVKKASDSWLGGGLLWFVCFLLEPILDGSMIIFMA